jgi:holo-[acyl-carrier protein] synthase
MAAVGLGTDIVSVARFAAALERYGERLLERLFTAGEIAYARGRRRPAESLAARFAAKEACFKAVGVGWPDEGVRFHDVEVVRDEAGPPRLALGGRLGEIARRRGARRALLTLAHSDESAVAVVLLEGDEGR